MLASQHSSESKTPEAGLSARPISPKETRARNRQIKLKSAVERIYSSAPFKPVWRLYYALADWWFRRYWRVQGVSRENPTRPAFLKVEVSNICNANCTFCAYQHQTRPKKVMSSAVFNKAIDDFDQLGGGALVLTPVVGESLVDKDFVEKVRYARSRKNITDIDLNSNGILLTREKFEELAQAGLTRVSLSISGLEREEYKRVYRVDKFDKIYRQLLDISESKYFKAIPFILNLRTDSLLPQRQPAYKELKRRGFLIDRAYAFSSWLGAIKSEDLTGWMFLKPGRPPKRTPCAFMWGAMGIFADGTMSACTCQNFDAHDDLCVGNIMEQNLADPWKHGKYDEIAQKFRDGDPPTPCKSCLHYRPAY
ncbi:MAG TPA: radical SAM/SPASM domain-containing protein [Verrucomicrobiae bacterium]